MSDKCSTKFLGDEICTAKANTIEISEILGVYPTRYNGITDKYEVCAVKDREYTAIHVLDIDNVTHILCIPNTCKDTYLLADAIIE